ncbi:uncharacterized protein LOC143155055 [Ptiloglossa arizonensis]|uniref:uncharacterized protein LOC143155055 n=1 Tax=Ptiloglossa arizonensis TaxID=3350558 RepID=UPI003F9FE44D
MSFRFSVLMEMKHNLLKAYKHFIKLHTLRFVKRNDFPNKPLNRSTSPVFTSSSVQRRKRGVEFENYRPSTRPRSPNKVRTNKIHSSHRVCVIVQRLPVTTTTTKPR